MIDIMMENIFRVVVMIERYTLPTRTSPMKIKRFPNTPVKDMARVSQRSSGKFVNASIVEPTWPRAKAKYYEGFTGEKGQNCANSWQSEHETHGGGVAGASDNVLVVGVQTIAY